MNKDKPDSKTSLLFAHTSSLNRKPVCRLHFNNENNLRLEPVGPDGKGEKYKIESLDEIYQYANQLIEAAKRYI